MPNSMAPVFSLTSTHATVLRDEVARRTTPHEIFTRESSLNGKVAMVTMPTSRFVFVRYGGNVTVEAPPTGDRVVATIPLGPMGVSRDYHVKPEKFASGFLLSQSNVTVMNPDPWAGALIIASDQEKLHTQKIKVLGESHTETSRLGTDSDLGMAAGNQWLTHTCRSLWNLASAIPAETPVLVVENFLQVMEDNLLNALILAVENSTAPSTVDGHRSRIIIDWIDTHFSEPLTVADLAAAVALSVRQLQACVQDQFSMTPIELLTDVRLSKLHSALLTSDSDQRTVASLMYSVGFTHLGRTSQIYREKYGESPSHTLKRSMHG